jgi:putative multicomponent Na+:H+ antiporter subunit B
MNNNDLFIYAIAALLPASAVMLLLQVNPYHALVIRGILGAVAALTYTLLGAADVALTEALVGTMLAITLYAIAVRSSLVMRLGIIQDDNLSENDYGEIINDLRQIFSKRHMRLELVPYTNNQALERALTEKEVHATCIKQEQADQNPDYHTFVRLKRIYEIIQTELASQTTVLTYVNTPDSGEKQT